MKTILSIDTSLSGCGIALCDGAGLSVSICDDAKYGQSERLIPMVKQLCADAGLSFSNIDGISVTNGPGAFTGIRVGLSTARALAVALNVPVIGFTTFDVLYAQYADEYAENDNVLIVLDTKRNDYFVQLYVGGQAGEAMALDGEAIKNIIDNYKQGVIIGNAIDKFKVDIVDINDGWEFRSGLSNISPLMLGQLAVNYIENNDVEQKYIAINAAPNYLKPADVSKSKKQYKRFVAD